jgi:hypothetical protein
MAEVEAMVAMFGLTTVASEGVKTSKIIKKQ